MNRTPYRIHLRALGCRLNEAELEQWAQRFLADGHRIARPGEPADVVVLNTCAVTGEASRKSRRLIQRLHREHPEARLVVTGCHASLEPDEVAGALGVDLVVRNDDKARLPELVQQAFDLPVMPAAATEPGATALYSRGRHRAFVKVQDGCRHRCTYCIVTVARGAERSRPVADIVAEIRRLHAQGIQEAVLTGVHVGGYGSDLGSDLRQLIAAILADTDLPRLRLASVEPWDLPDGFFRLFENPRLLPHMHLPLQSGSDRILRRMARRCRTADFERLVDAARAVVPHFNVTTDVIVGFPGEDEHDWQQTLDFVARIGFGHLHIFPFSPRAGTAAARLPGRVDRATQRRRCRELAALGERLQGAVLRAAVGRPAAVLWEGARRDAQGRRWYRGYTPDYLRVACPAPDGEEREHRITTVTPQAVDEAAGVLLAP